MYSLWHLGTIEIPYGVKKFVRQRGFKAVFPTSRKKVHAAPCCEKCSHGKRGERRCTRICDMRLEFHCCCVQAHHGPRITRGRLYGGGRYKHERYKHERIYNIYLCFEKTESRCRVMDRHRLEGTLFLFTHPPTVRVINQHPLISLIS